MLIKSKWTLFLLLLFGFIITYFLSRDYRSIKGVNPLIFEEPKQTSAASTTLIEFSKNGYYYHLTPRYRYEISAVVVHRMDYRWFSINNRDAIFPIDLCLVWGKNISDNIFREKLLHFRRDFRFCIYDSPGDFKPRQDQISNNHLLVNSPELEKKLLRLKPGDQVSLSGLLVDVDATKNGEISKYDPEHFTMSTSVTRQDGGAGACEVVYVQDIRVIRSGHPLLSFLNLVFFYSLAVLAVYGLFDLLKDLFHGKSHKKSSVVHI